MSAAVDGSASDAQKALAAEESWSAARNAVLKQARVVAVPIVNPSDTGAGVDADKSASTSAQRLFGSESENEVAELSSQVGGAVEPTVSNLPIVAQTFRSAPPLDDEPVVFGSYVHEILATVDLSGADVEAVARTLARRYGVTDASAARAIEMVERVLRLPVMDEARAATKIFREVPLAGNAAAGRTQGKPDLLFERGGEWKVVDFKTDRLDGSDAVDKYTAQLAGYSSSLAGVMGAEVKRAICLVRRGEVVDVR